MPFSSPFAGFSHDCTLDQAQARLLLCCRRPASSGSGPPPSLPVSQDSGQAQEPSPPAERGSPGRGSARATSARRRATLRAGRGVHGLGGRKAVLCPGDDLLIPAGTAHAVAATGDGPGRALVVGSPSGFARPITEAGTPDEGGGAPPVVATDMDLFLRVATELGDE